ncbi:MAG: ThuA domain-containing protein [Planctomycetes bacterium]|nr:ThuA domain-containing protein [Planctomycetota bacterium]
MPAGESRPQGTDGEKPIRVLFLGDHGSHQPRQRFGLLAPLLAPRGIELTWSDRPDDLHREILRHYDALVIYANITAIAPEQERALLEFVAEGGGFVPIHCASYCFLNSDRYVELVGARFEKHETGVFRARIAEPDHPVMRGFSGFESWDETYVHTRHNTAGRTVLEYRVEGRGLRVEGGARADSESRRTLNQAEPWTWVRAHGKGRVFYTAWGHDARTWSHAGFHNLLERGIRWAVGGDPSVAPDYDDAPATTRLPDGEPPFRYVPARVPFYPAGERWGTIGEPIQKMQEPLPAAESLQRIVTPVGFEPRLFAAEPDIGKPIALAWDERGRLWIAETTDYPNDLVREGPGNDRIRICEDADGDGRADRFTVFAEGLSIPTSLLPAYGGAIVHQAPHTLFLKDTDGDDRADVREVLFSGWSTDDTHAGPSNLRYALDGWIYGMVGYAGFEGEIAGRRQSFRTGFYRFRLGPPDEGQHAPRVVEFEFLRNTNNNSWGVGFSEEGLLFGSTANRNPSVYLPIPNRYYERVRGWSSSVLGGIALDHLFDPITANVRQVDHHGGFTAAAGHALYTARTWPRRYWNRTAFVNGPTGHLTAVFDLQSAGGDFVSRNAWNLLAGDDEWIAPIAAEVGPDGHVWILDWYNYIVQHNPTPAGYRTGRGNAYETDLRDKTHGRIYRIVHTAADQPNEFSLHDATNDELVAALGHSNMSWRLHAQRLLVERGAREAVPALTAVVADQLVDDIGLNPAAMHALWTLKCLGALDADGAGSVSARSNPEAIAAALSALGHPSAGVRRTAALVLPRTAECLHQLCNSGVLEDHNAQVRLAAFLALSEMPPAAEGAQAVLSSISRPENALDPWLPDALTAAAAGHDEHFLRQAAAAALDPGTQRVALAIVERVAEHYARGGPVESVGELLVALKNSSDSQVARAIMAGLARGWPAGQKPHFKPAHDEALLALLSRLPAESQAQLVRLGLAWGSGRLEQHAAKIASSLLKSVQNEKLAERERIDAARQLIEFRPESTEHVRQILDLLSPRTPPALARGLLDAVSRSTADAAGASIIESLSRQTPEVRRETVRVLLGRRAWTERLVAALEAGTVPLGELSLDQKQGLLAHPREVIATRVRRLLERGGALPNPDRQQVIERLMPLASQDGDADRGRALFEKHCSKCHVHSGKGTAIGPDLTGMAVHPKAELLVQMLDPSRSVEGNYRLYTVVTDEGRVFNGLLASETQTTLELFDTEGKRHVVLREEVEELVASQKSLMPEGFEKQLAENELVDLLSFLTARGRYVPLPLEKAATITSVRGMFYSEDAQAERLIFDDWSPKEVEGVPFHLVDPRGGRVPNAILLHGPQGRFPPQMPRKVSLPANMPAAAVHILGGVSGWGHPLGEKGSVSLIVRLHYADGKTEDHPLQNGVHLADYIRRVDVPESKFAFSLRARQLRYLSIRPQRPESISRIEFVKGDDATAPILMAVTVETPEK